MRDEVMELRRALAELTEKHQRELDELRSKLVAATTALESLERRVLGPKSEKMRPPASELRRTESKEDADRRKPSSPSPRRS